MTTTDPRPLDDPAEREARRVAALVRYAILDTPAEPDFDDIVKLAAATFAAPIAVVNLIAGDRQWFKAEVGIGARELPLDVSICVHALLERDLMVVPDTRLDPRFACNPLVTADDGLRFYAGALLRTSDGVPIGTVCVLDRQPRPHGITAHERLTLEVLARQVMAQLELQSAAVAQMARAEALASEQRERSAAQAALQRSEDRHRTLFEALDAGFCVVEMLFDGDGRANDYRFLEANPAFERQAGFSGVGRTMREIVPDHEQRWFDLYGRVALTGEPARVEQGSAALGRWWDVHAFPIDAPEAHRVAIFFTDVSERRRAELALRELNETLERQVEERTAALRLYENIVASDAAPICAFDTGHRLIAFNPAHNAEFFRVNGFETRIGDVFPDLFIAEQRPVMCALMDRALTGERFTVVEEFGKPELGIPQWEITYSPLRDEAGSIIGAFHHARDVSSRRRAEAELAEAQEALRQAQKMEAVGQLTGGLAHDFNNLLTGISGSLEMMGVRIAQGRAADVKRYVAAAQGAANRAAALTHRLLAFSRRQTLAPKPTDVRRLVVGMEELIRRTVGPAVAVETVNAAELWPSLIDPGQLENAVLNLCINARDAMPDGGGIVIETGNRWIDARTAEQRGLEAGEYVSLCVSDTGTGMPPDVIAKAFDPFFTTKPIGMGTGLGLSMIYGFARQSGGAVSIRSAVGQGTTVCVYLPRHRGNAEVEQDGATAGEARRAEAGETVLVVDDEPTVRMLVAEVLTDLGYTAIEAADGAAGLKIVNSDVRLDLLVTDVGLPGGMNGRQVADAARGVRPGLKVLFITGYAENAVLSHGDLDPGMHVLTKPFAIDALAGRIRELIEG